MKKVLFFHFASCPYCQETYRWIDEVRREHPELADVVIERVDEKQHPEIADAYDYWYVPTFYVDGVKAHEGACSKAKVEQVLRSAL